MKENNKTRGQSLRAIESGGIDFIEYLRMIRRRWLLIVLCVVPMLGLSAFLTLRMTKIYRATTTIRIETQAPKVLGRDVEAVDEMGAGSFWSNVEYYETQYKIIESREIASRVVKRFALNEDLDFLGVPKEERAAYKPASVDTASRVLQEMLTVEPVKDSRLVKIHIDNKDPYRAMVLADAIAKAYIDQNQESILKSTVDAVDWLAKKLDEAELNLSAAEQAENNYKKENGIFSLSLNDPQNILTAQMTKAATRLTEASSERIEIEAKKNAVAKFANVKDPMAIPLESINASPLVQQLKQEWGRLNQEHSELSERYGPNFPRMKELEAKLSRIEADINREVNNILKSVDAQLEAAKKAESDHAAKLSALQKQGVALGAKSVAFAELQRKKENAEKIYQLLIGRTKDAELSRSLRVNNVHILDSALRPEVPIKPRLYLNLILSVIAGLILGIILAVATEFSDQTIKTKEDIESLGVAFLGIIPSIDAKSSKEGPVNPDLFVHENPKSPAAESCRAIRTNLLFMSADHPAKRILITSPSPQEGKTTAAVNLAVVMARSGARVLLVDTDLRRPRVHEAFKLRSKNGISTMVLGESKREDSVIKSEIENLDILLCGPLPPNPSELMHTDRFRQVLDSLSAEYDHVIFDSPPIGLVTDAAVLSKSVDGTVLVVKSQKTTRDAVKRAVDVLSDIDARVLGAILNDLNLNDRRYGKHYYQYYKKYGYYYGSS
jgi:capsular exopolysaccharide synthesis family protein